MKKESYTGESLEKALVTGVLEHGTPGLEAMVRKSEKKGHVSITVDSCASWIDIPSSMVQRAEEIGISQCNDHSHPVMALTLREPREAEAKIFAALLASAMANQSASRHLICWGDSTKTCCWDPRTGKVKCVAMEPPIMRWY